MKTYSYVILNNAGHSWPMLTTNEPGPAGEATQAILPQLLQDGWVPVRETPMGGGASPLAHSLILLEKDSQPQKPRGRKAK